MTATSIQYELSKIVKIDAEQIAQKETLNPKNLEKILKEWFTDKTKQLKILLTKIL